MKSLNTDHCVVKSCDTVPPVAITSWHLFNICLVSFGWMSKRLLVTGLIALLVANQPTDPVEHPHREVKLLEEGSKGSCPGVVFTYK